MKRMSLESAQSRIHHNHGILEHMIFALILLLLLHHVQGHGHMVEPKSRNYRAWKDVDWNNCLINGACNTADVPLKEDTPQAMNNNGNTVVSQCGAKQGGGTNYDFPPAWNNQPLNWKSQAVYQPGSIITIKVAITAYHMGFFEFYACPRNQALTQDCFNKNPLTFVADNLYGAVKDSNYPVRAYASPQAPLVSSADQPASVMKYEFQMKLPSGLPSGDALIQWIYYTANSCNPPGYTQYPFPWPHGFNNLAICATPGSGERFWNCAEVTLSGTVTPFQSPSIPPVITPIAAPVIAPTITTSEPTPRPSLSPIPKTNSTTGRFRFAPYYELVVSSNPSLSGLKYATFAFILADSNKNASVELAVPWDNSQYSAIVSNFKNSGGIPILSFGGYAANMNEFAVQITNDTALQDAYAQFYINDGIKIFDFDIEDTASYDTVSQNRRHRALAALQLKYTDLEVMFTVAIAGSGILSNVYAMLQNAKSANVKISTVNAMIFDYGSALDPQTCIQTSKNALTNLRSQLNQIDSKINIGATLMIGKDDNGSIMNLANTKTLLDWVAGNMPSVTHISYWAMHRDKPGSDLSTSAGISGFTAGDFLKLFKMYGEYGTLPPTVSSAPATAPTSSPAGTPCGGGNIGNGICSNGMCCSKWGWCGTTVDYCGTGVPSAPSRFPSVSLKTRKPTKRYDYRHYLQISSTSVRLLKLIFLFMI